jgi:hypothetical protein
VGVYFSFKINQDYIAKNLCENRANPKLKCNGQCVLMKKLKKAEQEEQKNLPQTLKDKSEVLYYQNVFNPFSYNKDYATQLVKSIFNYRCQFISSFDADIFHPPQII